MGARAFNGSSSRGDRATVPSGVPLTIAGWIKPANITAVAGVCACVDPTLNTRWTYLAARGDVGGDPIQAMHRGDTLQTDAESTTGYSASTWQHAAAVFTSSTSRAAYLDGASKGTDTANPGTSTPWSKVSVGYLDIQAGDFDWFNGDIGSLGIWTIALSDADVASLAAGTNPLDIEAASLWAYWFDPDEASPGDDSSGNSRPLTLTSTSAASTEPPVSAAGGSTWPPGDTPAAPPLRVARSNLRIG
jgi:hypothetical protein